jgi:hypothetical protein
MLLALVLVLIVGVAGASLALLAGPRYLDRHRWANAQDGCGSVPTAPARTPKTLGAAYLWPYGAVYSCRVLDRTVHLFAEVAVSYVLVLETDTGPVLVRLDYTNINHGRQYFANATELSPTDADLSDADTARIDQAIQARGGRKPTPWTVHYGDG